MSSDDKYKKVFDLALDMICIADLKTDIFESVNRAFAETLGYEISELEGRSFINFVHPDDIEATNKVVEVRLQAGEEVLDFQNRYICKNGGIKWLQWRTRPDLKAMKIYAVARDITEQRQKQNLLERAESMLTLGNLAAGLAHELNNPLAGIVNSNQVIRNRLDPDFPSNRIVFEKLGISSEDIGRYSKEQQIPRLCDSIRETAQRASDILSSLFSFLHPEPEEFIPCEITDLIDEAEKHVRKFSKEMLNENKILIEKDYHATRLMTVCGKKSMIKALSAILENSFQLSYDLIEKDSLSIVLRTSTDRVNLTIEIEDDGPGISEEIQGRIYEPFFTTKPVGQGTGLGLTSAYYIITNLHKGNFKVESEEGKGTKTTISLPLAKTGEED